MDQSRDKEEILLSLIGNSFHIRELARQLEMPHATVQRRLNELLEEGVITHKTLGKNKVFSIKNSLQAKAHLISAEQYKLIKLLKKYPELSIVLEDVLKATSENVILFGSHSKFSAKKDSDIDIYIETKDKKIKEKVEAINSKIKVKIGLFDTNDLLIKEIIKNHVILRGAETFYERILV